MTALAEADHNAIFHEERPARADPAGLHRADPAPAAGRRRRRLAGRRGPRGDRDAAAQPRQLDLPPPAPRPRLGARARPRRRAAHRAGRGGRAVTAGARPPRRWRSSPRGHACADIGAGRGARAAAVPHRPARLLLRRRRRARPRHERRLVGHPAALRRCGSDRLALPWLMPLGVLLAGLGVALVGLSSSYAADGRGGGLSGLGVAAFHPEGARFANQVSGERRGQGMSFFSLGGNAGFALGPILVTPLVLVLGLRGTLLLAVLPTIVAVVLARELGRLRARRRREVRALRAQPRRRGSRRRRLERRSRASAASSRCARASTSACRPSSRCGSSTTSARARARATRRSPRCSSPARSGPTRRRASSTASGAGAWWWARPLVTIPVLVALVLAPSPLTAGLLTALAGFLIILTFSVTVVMGQEYLPNRLGLASGREPRARHRRRRHRRRGHGRRRRRVGAADGHVADRRPRGADGRPGPHAAGDARRAPRPGGGRGGGRRRYRLPARAS